MIGRPRTNLDLYRIEIIEWISRDISQSNIRDRLTNRGIIIGKSLFKSKLKEWNVISTKYTKQAVLVTNSFIFTLNELYLAEDIHPTNEELVQQLTTTGFKTLVY